MIKTIMMDIIFDNPLGNMHGPLFLLVYGLICLAAILYVRHVLPKHMNRSQAGHQKIPDRPDPYEIAYLWQTENELLVLVILNLVQRGYLALTKTKKETLLKQKEADVTLLSTMEKEVYHRLENECDLNTFVKNMRKDAGFMIHAESLDKHLRNRELLWSESDSKDFKLYKMLIVISLLLFGLYKLSAALYNGHTNVFGIIAIFIISSITLMNVQVNKLPSPKGRKLHEQLKQIFKPVYGDKLLKQAPYMQQLLLGIYGFGMLQESDYADFYTYAIAGLPIHRTIQIGKDTPLTSSVGNNRSGGSCSGGGCSGGSGCGGGCGGCGGCGG